MCHLSREAANARESQHTVKSDYKHRVQAVIVLVPMSIKKWSTLGPGREDDHMIHMTSGNPTDQRLVVHTCGQPHQIERPHTREILKTT